MRDRQGHGVKLSAYDFGQTTFFALQADQRVSYCLYVPQDYQEDDDKTYSLAVLMHGTGRTATGYRDGFMDFADAHDCILLAPLFPAGLIEKNDVSNYKRLAFHDMRFDLLLLAMVDEVAAKYRVRADRFLMFGFSGGGHFVHRFLYVHPERVLGVSIGAPGSVTLLDWNHDWWVGLRDFEARFGRPVDLAAMRRVAVQMVVGGDDTETWEIVTKPTDPGWMDGADLAGGNRQERLRSLRDSFESHGIAVRHDIVPGLGHEGTRAPMLAPVKAFFADTLAKRRAEAA
jgi:poly(3-hydroxybutyrate) depolymerase